VTRLALILLLVLVGSAHAAPKPAATCSVVPNPAPAGTAVTISGTIPADTIHLDLDINENGWVNHLGVEPGSGTFSAQWTVTNPGAATVTVRIATQSSHDHFKTGGSCNFTVTS
jgi:hypothetical protein